MTSVKKKKFCPGAKVKTICPVSSRNFRETDDVSCLINHRFVVGVCGLFCSPTQKGVHMLSHALRVPPAQFWSIGVTDRGTLSPPKHAQCVPFARHTSTNGSMFSWFSSCRIRISLNDVIGNWNDCTMITPVAAQVNTMYVQGELSRS